MARTQRRKIKCPHCNEWLRIQWKRGLKWERFECYECNASIKIHFSIDRTGKSHKVIGKEVVRTPLENVLYMRVMELQETASSKRDILKDKGIVSEEDINTYLEKHRTPELDAIIVWLMVTAKLRELEHIKSKVMKDEKS